MLSMNLEGPQMLEEKNQRESFNRHVWKIMEGNKRKRKKEGRCAKNVKTY